MAGYILKITIENTHPPVWRRIIIPEKITFADLHEMIQIVFGWEDEPCHDFRIPSKYICIDDGQELRGRYHYMEGETPVESFLLSNNWVRYTYDLGDMWHHKIVYEKTDETYEKRYATLLKFKGDNFLEDSEENWGTDECRSTFQPEKAEEQLKSLVCPVCNYPMEKVQEEIDTRSVFERLVECLEQSMKGNAKKHAAKRSVSQMKNKIDAWKEFVENWEDGTKAKTSGQIEYQQMVLPFVKEEDLVESSGDTWEIVVSEYTNRELLQALSYKEAKDYCKYLQIPVLDTWIKTQMTDAVADFFGKHPEYLLYIFDKDEYAELIRMLKFPEKMRKEKPDNQDLWIKGMALGLADISVIHGKNGNKAKISVASDAATLLQAVNAKERKQVYRKVKEFSDNLRNLILFYGIVELEVLYEIYCQLYCVFMERTEFNRYIYWYGRFNDLILTATAEDGESYVASPEMDLNAVIRKMKKFADDLEYIVYPVDDLKKMSDDIGEKK